MANTTHSPIRAALPRAAKNQPIRWGMGNKAETTATIPLLPEKVPGKKRELGRGYVVALHIGTGTHTVCQALADYGADPVIIRTRKEAHETEFHGLILLGGTDITPSYYGQATTHAFPNDKDRDYIEWVLAKRAHDMQVPQMGFCRGHQMLSIAHGGTLWQDIHLDGATKANHSCNNHAVRVYGPLAKRIGKRPTVNSYHHQAVRTKPFGTEIAAESEDGLIEAIWRPGLVSTQWHPELMDGEQLRKLMQWFFEGLGE